MSNYAIGARPIKLPSCRRSPSPLSRSSLALESVRRRRRRRRHRRLTLFRSRLPTILERSPRECVGALDLLENPVYRSTADRSTYGLNVVLLFSTYYACDVARSRDEYIILLLRK